MYSRKKPVFKKALLITVLVTLVAGYFLQLMLTNPSTLLVAQTATLAHAEGTLEAFDPYDYVINDNYKLGKQAEIDRRIASIKKDSPEVIKVRNYLASRGAPLANEAEFFVLMAAKYDLPYNLMPAISVIESNGGKYCYRPFNYAGMGGQGGAMTFNNFQEAIEKHAQILRYGYFDKGANTPAKIAPYYCPPCTTWHTKVSSVMWQIDNTAVN